MKLDASDLIKTEMCMQKRGLGMVYERFGKNVPNVIPEEKKLIVLIDIVGFSKSTTYKQWTDIMILQAFLKSPNFKISGLMKGVNVTHFVPTGDGCYILADECAPEAAIKFAFSIIQGFQTVQPNDEYPLSLRAGVVFGKVMPFRDLAMHLNYVGEGMNEGSRVLTYGQKVLEDDFIRRYRKELNREPENETVKSYSRNSLYLSDDLAPFAEDYRSQCESVFAFKDVADKHGKTRNITVLQGIRPYESE